MQTGRSVSCVQLPAPLWRAAAATVSRPSLARRLQSVCGASPSTFTVLITDNCDGCDSLQVYVSPAAYDTGFSSSIGTAAARVAQVSERGSGGSGGEVVSNKNLSRARSRQLAPARRGVCGRRLPRPARGPRPLDHAAACSDLASPPSLFHWMRAGALHAAGQRRHQHWPVPRNPGRVPSPEPPERGRFREHRLRVPPGL